MIGDLDRASSRYIVDRRVYVSSFRRVAREDAQRWADYRGSPVAVVHVMFHIKKAVPLERCGTADCLEDVFFPRWDQYDRADLPPGGAECCTALIYPWYQ